MVRVINFLPIISGRKLRKVHFELRSLSFPLRRIQATLEQVTSEVSACQNKFDSYIDGIEDFWQKRMTYSSCAHLQVKDLREALLDAYPYHYLRQPLQSLQKGNAQIINSIGRSMETLNTVLQDAARSTQERLEGWTRKLGIIAALAAPAFTFSQFIDLKLNSDRYPLWLERVLHMSLADLQTAAAYLVSGVLLVLFMASLLFLVTWLGGIVPKKPERFIEGVNRFERLVEKTSSVLDSPEELERIDAEATGLLIQLWTEAKRLRQSKSKPGKLFPHLKSDVGDWLRESQWHRYLIYLFLIPNVIPLPRALCLYRYKKATEFRQTTTISGYDFERSLRMVGFDFEAVRHLDDWLRQPDNQATIGPMDAATFAQRLKHYGVKAYPEPQAIKQWVGQFNAVK